MGHGSWRWLAGVGSVAAIGATVWATAPVAGASVTASARPTRPVAVAQPGAKYKPTNKTLTFGMHGAAVLAIQKRLTFLHYYAGKADGHFGWDTMEAVWAFKEIQSGKAIPSNPDKVTPFMQRQMLHPKKPKVLVRGAHWTRIEVNKDDGTLVVYHNRKIVLISHISSAAACRNDGCGWVTPSGTYRAWEYIPGAVADASFGGFMYNPVFFIGTTYAIHGMPDPTSTFSNDGVPLNAASHGCVRIPMDISVFLHRLIHVSASNGTKIYVIGGAQPDGGI